MQERAHFAVLALRILFIVIVVAAMTAGKPPAMAQTTVDAVQSEQISNLDARIKNHEVTDDARVDKLGTQMQTMSNQIAEMRGQAQGAFIGLGLVQVLAIVIQLVLQLRKDPKHGKV